MAVMIETRGALIGVEDDAGAGPALVFLHYWGGSARTWHHVAAALAPRTRCVRLDLRGWGRSCALDGRHDLEAMADDVADVVESLGLRRVVLVGHSMGGKIAQMLALRRLPGLAGLVLVAPAPHSPMLVPEEARAAMLASYQSREGVEHALAILAERPLAPQDRLMVLADTLRGAPGAKAEWTGRGMITDLGTGLADIALPAVIVVGSNDRVEHPDRLRDLYRQMLPAAAFQILDGVGHLSPLEAPDAVARACLTLLSRLDRPNPVD